MDNAGMGWISSACRENESLNPGPLIMENPFLFSSWGQATDRPATSYTYPLEALEFTQLSIKKEQRSDQKQPKKRQKSSAS